MRCPLCDAGMHLGNVCWCCGHEVQDKKYRPKLIPYGLTIKSGPRPKYVRLSSDDERLDRSHTLYGNLLIYRDTEDLNSYTQGHPDHLWDHLLMLVAIINPEDSGLNVGFGDTVTIEVYRHVMALQAIERASGTKKHK